MFLVACGLPSVVRELCDSVYCELSDDHRPVSKSNLVVLQKLAFDLRGLYHCRLPDGS